MEYVIRKEKKDGKLISLCIGIALYNIGLLGQEFSDSSYSVFNMLIYIGVLISGISVLYSLKFNFEDRGKPFKIIVSLMFFWYLIMAINSDLSYFLDPQSYLTPFSLLCYSMFFLLFFDRESILRAFVLYSYKIYVFFFMLCFIPLFFKINNAFLQFFLEFFAIGSAFIFISNKYHGNKMIYISGIVLMISFLIATLGARRNVMLTFSLYMLIGFLFLLFNGKIKSLESKFIFLILSFILLLAGIRYYESEKSGTFSKITARASENTRDEVFIYFASDMVNVKDLVIGRGFSGEYYCPGVDKDDSGETSDYRKNIECAYLQWILNGGIIYLLLYITLFLYAIYKGFKARNQLLKGFACIMIVQLIDMLPFGLHAFNMKTFFVWMSVSICLDERLLRMNDYEIKAIFFKNKIKLLPWEKK